MSLPRSFVDLMAAAMQDCKTVGLSVCCGSNVELVCDVERGASSQRSNQNAI